MTNAKLDRSNANYRWSKYDNDCGERWVSVYNAHTKITENINVQTEDVLE